MQHSRAQQGTAGQRRPGMVILCEWAACRPLLGAGKSASVAIGFHRPSQPKAPAGEPFVPTLTGPAEATRTTATALCPRTHAPARPRRDDLACKGRVVCAMPPSMGARVCHGAHQAIRPRLGATSPRGLHGTERACTWEACMAPWRRQPENMAPAPSTSSAGRCGLVAVAARVLCAAAD